MSFEGDHLHLEIDGELTAKLRNLVLEQNVTLNMALLAVYNILLAKYTDQEDIVVGSPIAGRDYPGLEKILGMFVNMLSLRNYPENQKTYVQFLAEVKENSLKSYDHQNYPFEMLVDKLELQRDLSRNPVFDTVFGVHNGQNGELSIPGLRFTSHTIQNKVSRFDLTWNVTEEKEKIHIDLEYSTRLYQEDTIVRLVDHFKNIISEVTQNPELLIADIQMISAKEKAELLSLFSVNKAEFPREKTMQQLFEEQVEIRPDQMAVVFEERSLTYLELNQRANQLARVLREKGAGPDQIVGLVLSRSLEMMIGILGVIKSGGAYLPIDPDYPVERIEYTLQDSKTRLLLTDQVDSLNFAGEVIDINDKTISLQDRTNVEIINNPTDLLYIIYTSGSTGKPKGVMIEHQNVVSLLFPDTMLFDFTHLDIWTLFHSYCFDFSVWEMYGALLYGGKLVVIPKLVAQNPAEYLETLRKEEVTVLNQTPTAFYKLSEEELKSTTHELKVRYIIFGGEALKPLKLKEWHQLYPKTRLINMYGITETTVHVTFKEITEQEISSNVSNIGKPIPTLTTYIMDKTMNLLPIGVPGELCVGGDGLARGYLNRPELTDEKFVPHPYIEGEKLYRSGDLARLLSNGEMEYLGRIDHQVKIRGFRIELGEIENQLLQHNDIKEVAVLERKDKDSESYLAAYLVSDKELSVSNLRTYLKKVLPDYMIPSYFIRLDQLPLTTNGKLNRKALPEPNETIEAGRDYIAPTSVIEEQLVKIWSEILGIEKIGVEDDFFELGGHSLKATTLIQKIRKELNAEISLKDIFKTSRLKELAEIVQLAKESIYSILEPAKERDYYPVSASQKRLFVFDQIQGQNTIYNIPQALIIEGKIDLARLKTIIQRLVNRHEAFRTSFTTVEDEVVQVIHPEIEFEINELELNENSLDEVIKNFVKPFDLAKAPLLRIGLGKIENRQLLIFDMHHIISDGTSTKILIQEFVQIYTGEEPNALRVQYKDFAIWQNQLFASNLIKKQEEYWTETFATGVPELKMVLDHKRPDILTLEGDSILFELSKELTDQLNELAANNKATLFMTLLALLNILLYKYTAQEEIVVGTSIAGRTHPDLENIIGMFINTLALKNNPTAQKNFNQFIQEVKDNTLRAFENQDYQYEMLVEKLGLHHTKNRTPLFDIMLVVQNMDLKEVTTEKFKVIPHNLESKTAKFDITLYVVENNGLKFNLNYRTSLFNPETMELFKESLLDIIKDVIENPDKQIVDLGRKTTEDAVVFDDFMDDLEDEF